MAQIKKEVGVVQRSSRQEFGRRRQITFDPTEQGGNEMLKVGC